MKFTWPKDFYFHWVVGESLCNAQKRSYKSGGYEMADGLDMNLDLGVMITTIPTTWWDFSAGKRPCLSILDYSCVLFHSRSALGSRLARRHPFAIRCRRPQVTGSRANTIGRTVAVAPDGSTFGNLSKLDEASAADTCCPEHPGVCDLYRSV
jgi:hypothetical protein